MDWHNHRKLLEELEDRVALDGSPERICLKTKKMCEGWNKSSWRIQQHHSSHMEHLNIKNVTDVTHRTTVFALLFIEIGILDETEKLGKLD